MSFLVDEEWLDAPRGSFLRIPAGVTHTFENRNRSRAARSTKAEVARFSELSTANRRRVRTSRTVVGVRRATP